jgi:hypothetical protein
MDRGGFRSCQSWRSLALEGAAVEDGHREGRFFGGDTGQGFFWFMGAIVIEVLFVAT